MMVKEIVLRLSSKFDECAHIQNECEYLYAREIMEPLAYSQWRNFEAIIIRSKVSCETAKIAGQNHFADVSKMVKMGSDATREASDHKSTHYACHLVA